MSDNVTITQLTAMMREYGYALMRAEDLEKLIADGVLITTGQARELLGSDGPQTLQGIRKLIKVGTIKWSIRVGNCRYVLAEEVRELCGHLPKVGRPPSGGQL